MKFDKKRFYALLSSIASFSLILGIMNYQGRNVTKELMGFGKIFLTFVPLMLAFMLLDKLGIVDFKKEEERRKELGRKLKANKKARLWLIAAFIGFFVIFAAHFFLFLSPEEKNPSTWSIENELVINSYWLLSSVFYSFNLYVFLFGKNILSDEKGKKIGHFCASTFTFALFTVYLIGANDQPNLMVVTSTMCSGITWVQYSLIQSFRELRSEASHI